jgi:hypothetical protein
VQALEQALVLVLLASHLLMLTVVLHSPTMATLPHPHSPRVRRCKETVLQKVKKCLVQIDMVYNIQEHLISILPTSVKLAFSGFLAKILTDSHD